MDALTSVIIASLLHDIGKVLYRAGGSTKTHSKYSAEFVKEYIGDPLIQQMVEYHHSEAIKNSNIPDDSMAYIVYEADNIAAATDRRKQEGSPNNSNFNKNIALHSIFNVLKLDTEKDIGNDKYKLKLYDEEQPIILLDKNYQASSGDYISLRNFLENKIKLIGHILKQQGNVVNSILKLLENAVYCVPSSTNKNEIPDISLYDHSKLTAAIASCMYLYCKQNQITNYRHIFFDNTDKTRNTKMYIIMSGDLSGIQDFIYTISSKGALKSLRGRSFLLEIMTENIIDEILDSLNLSRANLLYSGGGHFYLLLPNTKDTIEKLQHAQQKLNDWFLEKYGTMLYIQLAWIQASANDLTNDMGDQSLKKQNKTGKLFAQLSTKLSKGKIQRYTKQQLISLMDPDSEINTIKSMQRECAICGASNKQLVELKPEEQMEVCVECKALYLLGDKLARIYDGHVHNEDDIPVIVVKNDKKENNLDLELPSLSGQSVFLNTDKLKKVNDNLRQQKGNYKRIYSINRHMIGKDYTTNLWTGIYNKTFDNIYGLADFETLARNSKGVKRLGVLRADVDDLGETFSRGFEIKNASTNKYKYITISRYAMLSRILSMFFKYDINKICQGEYQDTFIFGNVRTDKQKNLVIVYSGGDDVFIVGAWNEIISFAVELYDIFTKFTQRKLTFSAGIGMFKPSFPIYQMASITGKLEDMAKRNGKDSIALFDASNTSGDKLGEHVYKWEQFIQNVCNQKINMLNKWFYYDETKVQPDKIYAGTTFIYKLINLYRSIMKGGKINLARIAYTLARIEPSQQAGDTVKSKYAELKQKIYKWALNEQDTKELITALTLIVYLNRKEG